MRKHKIEAKIGCGRSFGDIIGRFGKIAERFGREIECFMQVAWVDIFQIAMVGLYESHIELLMRAAALVR